MSRWNIDYQYNLEDQIMKDIKMITSCGQVKEQSKRLNNVRFKIDILQNGITVTKQKRSGVASSRGCEEL